MTESEYNKLLDRLLRFPMLNINDVSLAEDVLTEIKDAKEPYEAPNLILNVKDDCIWLAWDYPLLVSLVFLNGKVRLKTDSDIKLYSPLTDAKGIFEDIKELLPEGSNG